jgi:hypothetical protein
MYGKLIHLLHFDIIVNFLFPIVFELVTSNYVDTNRPL